MYKFSTRTPIAELGVSILTGTTGRATSVEQSVWPCLPFLLMHQQARLAAHPAAVLVLNPCEPDIS
jgi:hypothetical protein